MASKSSKSYKINRVKSIKGQYKKRLHNKYSEGKICPKCNNGKLMSCNCSNCNGHCKHLVMCRKCKHSFF